MFKKLAILSAFALLGAAGAQAQVVNCNVAALNGACVTQGVLDADGFTVSIAGLSVGPAFYSIETFPAIPGQSNDTKILNNAGALLADDELNHGYDRWVCGTAAAGAAACTNVIKILPFGAPTNQPVRVLVSQLDN